MDFRHGTETGDGDSRIPLPGLTTREIEVLLTWLRSDSRNSVAAILSIAPATVGAHISRIRHKYDSVGRRAPTKAALVARALQDNLIDLKDL